MNIEYRKITVEERESFLEHFHPLLKRPDILTALDAGYVQIAHCKAKDVFEVNDGDPEHDERHFFFSLENEPYAYYLPYNNQVCHYSGYGTFPNREFDVIRLMPTNIIIKILCKSESLFIKRIFVDYENFVFHEYFSKPNKLPELSFEFLYSQFDDAEKTALSKSTPKLI